MQGLQHLKDKGFRYVLVKGFTTDRRLAYIELNYFMLIPIKELPEDPTKKEIYEPISSKILADWASFPDDGIKILVAMDQQIIN